MKPAMKIFLICFLASTLVFSLLSLVIVQSLSSRSGLVRGDGALRLPHDAPDPYTNSYTGQSTNVLWMYTGTSEGRNETMYSMLLLRIDQERGKVFYTPIPTNMLLPVGGIKTPLNTLYEQYGADYLCEKIHSLLGLEIDCYVTVTSDTLIFLLNEIEGLTYNVPSDVREYDRDGTLRTILSSGTKRIFGKDAAIMLQNRDPLYIQHAKLNNEVNFAKALMARFLSDSHRSRLSACWLDMGATTKTNHDKDEPLLTTSLLESMLSYESVVQHIVGEYQSVGEEKYFLPDTERTLAQFISYKKIYNTNQ